jgi:hypothetical protein
MPVRVLVLSCVCLRCEYVQTDGRLFGWGSNNDHQLGLALVCDVCSVFVTCVQRGAIDKPTEISLPDVQVQRDARALIAAGFAHSMLAC